MDHADIDHAGLTGVGGSVATDAIWDAAGDLAVGSGANTAAKLTKGAAGGALSIINAAVAWNSGTSFPASKLTGDRYWRTDIGLEFFWDGTRWVSTQVSEMPVVTADTEYAVAPADALIRRFIPAYAGTYDIYIMNFRAWTNHGATNDASNYYTYTLFDQDNTDLGHFDTSGDTAGTNYTHNVAVDTVHASGTTGKFLFIYRAKTGTPNIWRMTAMVSYRVIAT